MGTNFRPKTESRSADDTRTVDREVAETAPPTMDAQRMSLESIMEIEWDADLSPIEYLDMARELGATKQSTIPYLFEYNRELKRAVESAQEALVSLSNRHEWAVERPAVHLNSYINQSGNLTVRWQPSFEPPRVCRRLFGLSHAAMAGWSSVA